MDIVDQPDDDGQKATTIMTTTAPIVTMLHMLASALDAYSRRAEGALVQARGALHMAGQPSESKETVRAIDAFDALVQSVVQGYTAAANQIDTAHGGALRFGTPIPVTAGSMRLEAKVAPFMPQRWLREQAELSATPQPPAP